MQEYDVHTTTNVALRNSIITGISLLSATALTWQLFTAPPERKDLKTLYALLGLTASTVGVLAANTTKEVLDIRSTYYDVSRLVRANTIYARMSQPTSSTSVTHEPFRWDNFKTLPNEYPHALVLGATGGGKSTLAENLAGLMQPSTVYAVVPHWQQGDFSACHRIIGIARNVGDGFDGDPTATAPLYRWADIEGLPSDAPVSACEFMHALYWEMHRRYGLDGNGRFIGESEQELVVILDEFLLYAKLPGMASIWKKLVREARKVRIRLVLLVQGDSVAALGIEGEGDIRESLRYIYLQDFARQHLERCYSRATTVEQIQYYTWARQEMKSHRPCMVEEELAILPQPGEFNNGSHEQQSSAVQLRKDGRSVCVARGSVDTSSSPQECSGFSTPATPPTAYTPYAPDRADVCSESGGAQVHVPVAVESEVKSAQAPGKATQQAPEEFLEGYDEIVSSLTPEQLDSSLRGLHAVAVEATKSNMPSGAPYTREAIIKKVWGYQSSQYKMGKVLWALAESKFGRIPLKE